MKVNHHIEKVVTFEGTVHVRKKSPSITAQTVLESCRSCSTNLWAPQANDYASFEK